jgi:hypothetical protein
MHRGKKIKPKVNKREKKIICKGIKKYMKQKQMKQRKALDAL